MTTPTGSAAGTVKQPIVLGGPARPAKPVRINKEWHYTDPFGRTWIMEYEAAQNAYHRDDRDVLLERLTAAQQAAQAAIESEARLVEALNDALSSFNDAERLPALRSWLDKGFNATGALEWIEVGNIISEAIRVRAALSTHPSAREQDGTSQNQS